MKKLTLFVVTLVAIMFAAPAFADSPGQLSNGDDNYKVKNVTKNSAYGKSASLACGETVKYSVLFANSDFGQLENVTVKASLPNSLSISGKNVNGETTSATGSVNVSVPAGATLSYVAGSTNYYVYNADGSVKSTKTLADGVAAGGINTGTLAGSTQARVYFQAKVHCPTKPPVKPPVKKITVCELSTKKTITIKESDFDSKKHSKDLKDCEVTPVTPETPETPETPKTPETPVTPAELPKTGADSALVAIVLSAATTAAVYAVAGRKNLLG